jgi:hypothetical protein
VTPCCLAGIQTSRAQGASTTASRLPVVQVVAAAIGHNQEVVVAVGRWLAVVAETACTKFNLLWN